MQSKQRLALFVPLGIALAVAVAVLTLSGGDKIGQPSHTATPPGKLTATVGALGEVTLTDSSGHAITRLPSGRYTVLVTVNSSDGDFHLTGPSVRRTTAAHFVGLTIWGVHLLKGTYRYENNRSGRGHDTAHVIAVY
jgi:hypothetical protein